MLFKYYCKIIIPSLLLLIINYFNLSLVMSTKLFENECYYYYYRWSKIHKKLQFITEKNVNEYLIVYLIIVIIR